MPVARSGRAAAQKANERIIAKQEVVIGEGFSRKNKKKEASVKEANEDVNWVQCDRCQKWRLLPPHINMKSLPDVWFCEMNTYDEKRNNCSAKEQTAEEAKRERLNAESRRDKGESLKSPKKPSVGSMKVMSHHTPKGGAAGSNSNNPGVSRGSSGGLPRSVGRSSNGSSSAQQGGGDGKRSSKNQAVEDLEWVQCEKVRKGRAGCFVVLFRAFFSTLFAAAAG